MAENLLPVMYGPLRLYVVDYGTDIGRSQVPHEPSRGDRYPISDRGLKLERTRCQLVFCDVSIEKDSPATRYKAFKDLVATGVPQIFVHPIHGSYRARIGDCDLSGSNEGDAFHVSCEFLQDEPPIEILDVTTGASSLAGPEAVATAAANAAAALGDLRALLEPPGTSLGDLHLLLETPGHASTAVERWQSDDVDARTVYAEAGAIVRDLDDLVVQADLATDLKRWQAYCLIVSLRERVREAAAAAAGTPAQVFLYIVRSPTPLRVILARVYGPADVDARAPVVIALNNIRAPWLVPAGVYRLPALEAGP